MKKVLFFLFISIAWAYPNMLDVPDTTITEGDTLLIQVSGLSWQHNGLTFSVSECPIADTLWDVGRTGGCTCSETRWSAFFRVTTDITSSGSYSFVFTCTDTAGRTDSDTMQLFVENLPFPPEISGFPDTVLYEHDTLLIDLDAYVSDPDHPDSLLSWDTVESAMLFIDIVERQAKIFLLSDFFGMDTVILRVTDPDGDSDLDTFIVETINVNDPPVIAEMPESLLTDGGAFTIILDNFVTDPEDDPETMSWSHFGNRIVSVSISPDRIATIAATCPLPFAIDTVFFIAEDPGGIADTAMMEVFLLPSAIKESEPSRLTIGNVIPNPFNSTMTIDIPETGLTQVKVFDQSGKIVYDGIHSVTFQWDFSPLPSGIYMISIQNDGNIQTRRAVYLK